MDYSLPGSSVHGILQARILEWVAIPLSRGSFWPRDRTQVSCIAGRLFTIWLSGSQKLFLKKKTKKTTFFPYGSAGKESTCNVGDLGLIPWLGRSPGGRKDYPLQYSGLENSTDSIVHGVAKSQTGLSDFHSHIYIHNYLNRIFTIEFSKVLLNGIQLSQFQLRTISPKQTDEERK